MDVIFRLSQGSSLAGLTASSSAFEALQVERLYDFGPELNHYRNARGPTRFRDDEAAFELEVLPTLDEDARNVYRTYIVRNADQGLLAALEASMDVDYAQVDEENELYEDAFLAPNDPSYPAQWGMAKTQCERAWANSTGDGVIVAIVDTGVDYNNNDIAANMWRNANGHCGYDFSTNSTDPRDPHGHGTHVAGIVAAIANNGLQIAGVAPRARIMAVRIFPNAFDSRCAAGIKYAADNGAKIINNSWGPTGRRPTNNVVEDAIAYAQSRGALVVFAAGNANDDVKYYAPANSPRVISVAATTTADSRASYSNYGAVTVAAPGSDILSLSPGSANPVLKSGTSMAAPFVSGALALYVKLNPHGATLDNVRKTLQASADAISTDKPIGKRLNIGKLVVKPAEQTIHVQEPVSHSYKGVTGCAQRAQDEAMIALRRWRDRVAQRYPAYVVTAYSHLGGTARTESKIDYWTQKRSCKTTLSITCWADLRVRSALDGETEAAAEPSPNLMEVSA